MEETINISELNDFIFCPISIYFHGLYGNLNKLLYQGVKQISGTKAHENIDKCKYSSKKSILQGEMVYSQKYNIIGKIDLFDLEKGLLIERKNKVNQIFDGFIFQVYAQYYALNEMGYKVNEIKIYSMKDNKSYNIPLPINSQEFSTKFDELIINMRNFDIKNFEAKNTEKCKNCIYNNLCDRSLV